MTWGIVTRSDCDARVAWTARLMNGALATAMGPTRDSPPVG